MTCPSDEILRVASDWAARLRRDDATAEDRERHRAWMAKCVDHRNAYQFVLETCDLAMKASVSPSLQSRGQWHEKRAWCAQLEYFFAGGRVARTVAIVTATFLTIAGLYYVDMFSTHYRTEVGEVRTITLRDGSKLTLNAATAIEVNFTEETREILLKEGQVVLEIAKSPSRPFRVRAGDRTIQDIGTVFDVDRHGADIDVAVREGVVLVSTQQGPISASHSKDNLLLSSGQIVSYAIGQQLGAPRDVPPEQIGSWREGFLSYTDMPLSRVIADLNRQFKGQIKIEDPLLASMPVSLILRLQDRDKTLQSLQRLLGVRVIYKERDLLLIAPAAS